MDLVNITISMRLLGGRCKYKSFISETIMAMLNQDQLIQDARDISSPHFLESLIFGQIFQKICKKSVIFAKITLIISIVSI